MLNSSKLRPLRRWSKQIQVCARVKTEQLSVVNENQYAVCWILDRFSSFVKKKKKTFVRSLATCKFIFQDFNSAGHFQHEIKISVPLVRKNEWLMQERENGYLLTYGEQAKKLLVSHLYEETTANGVCDWFKAH